MAADHPGDAFLQDCAEGRLAGEAALEIERHLAVCADCREQVVELRALLARLADLPRSLQPPRDLRPGIWRAIGDAGAAGVESAGPRLRDRTLSSMRWQLAAAALVLAALSALVTAALTGPRGLPSDRPVAADVRAPIVLATGATYATAAAELQAILDENRARLDPETLALIETSLRIIDRALEEASSALADDPGNANLSRILLATHEKKLELLRRAAHGPVGI